MSFTYYKHIETSEGGRNAAIKDAAERRLQEIKAIMEDLKLEQRFHEGVLLLIGDSVCDHCGGNGSVTYYPAGTGPGQGARSSIPCPKCHAEASKKASDKLDKQYRGY